MGRVLDALERAKKAAATDKETSKEFPLKSGERESVYQRLTRSTLDSPPSHFAQRRLLRVFLCHASDDKPAVRSLYARLQSRYIHTWLDEEDLLPGQDWKLEIPKAVTNSDIVIVCLSRNAINKRGFVQKEIEYALDVAGEQPEGAIFIIPLKLEECEVPDRLSRWQWVSLFEEKGYDRLMRAFRHRAESLGITAFP